MLPGQGEQPTARSKTEPTEAEGDEDGGEEGDEDGGEEEDLQFDVVSCGAMHTMLVTAQGRMLLAVYFFPFPSSRFVPCLHVLFAWHPHAERPGRTLNVCNNLPPDS